MSASLSSPPTWRAGSREIDLSRPRLIAILNLTPDSFADGGRIASPEDAARAAAAAALAGASAIDVGGESTRPGAARIPADEQIRRVVPAVVAIRRALGDAPAPAAGAPRGLVISIDTTLADVARAALDAGADAINDVAAGTEDERMLPLAAERRAGLILMHRLRPPTTDRFSDRYTRADTPDYGPRGVVEAVKSFLAERVRAARAAGITPDRIVIDPGLGFGKTVEQNLELVRRAGEFVTLDIDGHRHPVLSALSRKSFVARAAGALDPGTGEPLPPHSPERLAATLELSKQMASAGCQLLRVHDVTEHQVMLASLDAGRAC